MDSEHRHDLKENDLQEFLANFGEWRKKYGATVLMWVLLIAVVVVGWNFYHSYTRTTHDTAWDDLAGTTSPAGYQMIPADHSDKTVRLLAELWGGDAYLQSAVSPPTDDERFNAAEALGKAEENYQQVLASTQEPLFRANAYLGLGAVAEARENFEQAAEYYDQAIAAAQPQYGALAQRAAQRKAMLARLAEPVVFGQTSAASQAADWGPTLVPQDENAGAEPATPE